MSQENVDTIRRGYEAFTQGDMDAVLDLVGPEFELHGLAGDLIALGDTRGPKAFVQWIEQFTNATAEVQLQPEEFIDAGDQVVVPIHVLVRGKGIGVPTELHFAQVWTFRDGKVVRLDAYADKAEALEAVGLQE